MQNRFIKPGLSGWRRIKIILYIVEQNVRLWILRKESVYYRQRIRNFWQKNKSSSKTAKNKPSFLLYVKLTLWKLKGNNSLK